MSKNLIQFISLAGVYYALFNATQNADGTLAITRVSQLSKDLDKEVAKYPNAKVVDGLKGGTNFIGTPTENGAYTFTKVASAKSSKKTAKEVEAVNLVGTDLENVNLVLCKRTDKGYAVLYTMTQDGNTQTLNSVKNVSVDLKKAKALYPTAVLDNTLPSGKTIIRELDENGAVLSAKSSVELAKEQKAIEKAEKMAQAQAQVETEQVETEQVETEQVETEQVETEQVETETAE